MDGFAIGVSLSALFLSLVAILIAVAAIGDVWAFKRSTHNVQFVSAEDEAKESLDDKIINKTLEKQEYKAMNDAFGQERDVNK